MQKASIYMLKAKTLASSRLRQAYSLASKHKRLNYGSALVLAVLAVPFAVQAVNGSFEPDNEVQVERSEEQMQLPEVKAEATQESSSSSSENTQQGSSSSSNSDVNVQVNGQNVPMPESGTLHKRITDGNSETVVDVEIDNGSGSSTSSSSTSIHINQHSFSSGDETQEGGNSRHPARR